MTQEETTSITSNSNEDGAGAVASGAEVVAGFEKAYRDALAKFKADKTNKDLRRARTAAKKAWDASVLQNCLKADNGAEQLYCKDCSQKFLWTTEEQDYYKAPERNWRHKPLRCRNCAELQKERRRDNNKEDPDGDGDEKTENDGENSDKKEEVKKGKGGKGRHMCYAFQRGECKYGDECKFNHDPDFAGKKKEVEESDDNEDGENSDGEATSKKRKVVPDVIATCKWGKECNMKRCRFKHGRDDDPSPPPTSKSVANEATNDGKDKDKKGDDKNAAAATPPIKKQKTAVTGICKWGKDCKLKRCRFRHDDSSPLPPVDDKVAVCVEVNSTTTAETPGGGSGDTGAATKSTSSIKDKNKDKMKKKDKTVVKAMTKALKKAPNKQLKMKELRKLIQAKTDTLGKDDLKIVVNETIANNKDSLVLLEDGKVVKLL